MRPLVLAPKVATGADAAFLWAIGCCTLVWRLVDELVTSRIKHAFLPSVHVLQD
jgi:hypothetical protein